MQGEDPYIFLEWNVSYGTRSPLGTLQQIILINDEFPGPNINSTTNNNIHVNVFNNIDEPILFTWWLIYYIIAFGFKSIHSFLSYFVLY